MKLVRVDYDSKEQFSNITVRMSRAEAAGLVNKHKYGIIHL